MYARIHALVVTNTHTHTKRKKEKKKMDRVITVLGSVCANTIAFYCLMPLAYATQHYLNSKDRWKQVFAECDIFESCVNGSAGGAYFGGPYIISSQSFSRRHKARKPNNNNHDGSSDDSNNDDDDDDDDFYESDVSIDSE